MDGSTAAVIGATVGAIGGLGGGWLTVLGQSRQRREQRLSEAEHWRIEMRRDAYNAFIAAAKRLSAAWWRLSDQLVEVGSTPAEWQARFHEAHDVWVEFSTAAAAVSVAGPRDVASAADDLRRAMSEWESVCTAWTHAAVRSGTNRLDQFEAPFNAAAQAKRAPDKAFQEVARRALGTDS